MNTNYGFRGLRGRLGRAAGIAALVCCCVVPSLSHAAPAPPKSPVGTWDCLMSGSGQQGIAFIRFSSNGSSNWFSGYELQATPPKTGGIATVVEGRNDTGDTGRVPGLSATNATGTPTNNYVFGFTSVQGPWTYDSKGRVIGYFTQVINPADATTNWLQTCVNTNAVLTALAGTNQYASQTGLYFCFTNSVLVTNASLTVPLTFANTATPQVTTVATNWLPTCVNTNVLLAVTLPGRTGTNQFFFRSPLSCCFSNQVFATNGGFSVPLTFTNGNFATNVYTDDWPPMTVHTNLLFRDTNADGIEWTLYAALDLTFSGPAFTTNYTLGAILTNYFTISNLDYPAQEFACVSTNVSLFTNVVDQYGETLTFTASAVGNYCFTGPSLDTNIVFTFGANFPITFVNTNSPTVTVTTNYAMTCTNADIELAAVFGEGTPYASTNLFQTNAVFCFSDPVLATNFVAPDLFVFTNTQPVFVQTTNWPQICVGTNLQLATTLGGNTTWTSTNLFFCFAGQSLQTNFTYSPTLQFTNSSYTITPGPGTSTNLISFVGTVVPNKRLALVASTSFGKVTYSGVPLVPSRYDLGGPWYAYKTQSQPVLEFFSLTPFTASNPWSVEYPDLSQFPNIYYTSDGIGPASSFFGISMLSTRNRVGFAFETTPSGASNVVLSATYGTLSASRRATNAVTKGIEEPLTSTSFKATKQ
jgi:hypothetical protein